MPKKQSAEDTTNSKRQTAQWIWTGEESAPVNRFTNFRKVVNLSEIPEDATLLFAADSNARLLINGSIVRRKVARYDEPNITAETVNAGPYLKAGANVIEVLHHNWGSVITFQRTGNKHAGLLVAGSWLGTDSTWKWAIAPEYQPHESQVIGINGGAHRIRFPLVVDGRKATAIKPSEPSFDDSAWKPAVVVTEGPWKKTPPDAVESPGQRESAVSPHSVLAAGTLTTTGDEVTTDVYAIAEAMRTATYLQDEKLTSEAASLIVGQPVTLRGKVGESVYVTFDFARPVHGYPLLKFAAATSGTMVDVGYAEIPFSLYSGDIHVKPNGWINPLGVVGKGYGDRYICRDGSQQIELPDERTARWLTLHVHFPAGGEVVLSDASMIKSQFPIKPIGTFECGDLLVDQIVKLSLTHAEVTMTDSYVDTPGREDGQWIEDAQLRALISERWFGDTTLRRFMLRTHAQAQGKDGQMHPFAPSNYPAYPAPYDWSVQWVATLYDEYMWSGDKDIVRKYWPVLTKYWQNVLAKVNVDGLWQTNHVLADINVGVRPATPKHSSGIVTPMVMERLGWSIVMAEAAGESAQAAQWREQLAKMKDAFRKFHVVPASGNVPLHVGDVYDPEKPNAERGYSQAGQLTAIFTALLSPEEARADLDYAFPAPQGDPPSGISRWNNPTMCYRALRALSQSGMTSRAVDHMKERFSQYLPGHPANPVDSRLQGPHGGPLPEYWISRKDRNVAPGQINTAQPSDPTGSHGWAAVPLQWLHESLLGVTIASPGGQRLRIAPETGGLPYVSGWTNTPHGPVHVYYDPQQWRIEITLPAGVVAEFVPPAEFKGKRIRLAGNGGRSPKPVGADGAEIAGPGQFVIECY